MYGLTGHAIEQLFHQKIITEMKMLRIVFHFLFGKMSDVTCIANIYDNIPFLSQIFLS